MADVLDIIGGGPTIRLTLTAADPAKVIRLSDNASSKRQFDMRLTGPVRCRLGGSDVAVSTDTTNDTTNGRLGRYYPRTQRWPINMRGPDSQYLAVRRAEDASGDVVFELSQTLETHLDDVPTVVG